MWLRNHRGATSRVGSHALLGAFFMWNDIKQSTPPLETEVLVWVDGHRGPAWANNYALVAYLHPNGKFYQERHPYAEPIVGVLYWREIEKPNAPAQERRTGDPKQ